MPTEINLPVPYLTQHGPDSTASNNDCGAASLAMVSSFYGVKKSVGEILQLCGNPTGYISFSTLSKVADSLGFNVASASGATFDHILGYLQKGMPVIVLGGYGGLHSVQDQHFHDVNGSHIMVVVGVRPDNSLYVNDPDFWGPLVDQGNHHVYTFEEFVAFWSNPGGENKPNTLFVINPKVEQKTEVLPEKLVVTTDKGVNGRKSPVINPDNIDRVFSQGTELSVVAKVSGDPVSGNNTWYQINYNGSLLFISASASIQLIYPKLQSDPPQKAPTIPQPDLTSPDYLQGLVTVYKTVRDILKSHNALPDEQVGFWDKLKEALKIK